ncbi:hypothetical protein CcaverHIS002_0705290 [Cutaneotrichosporon cavernicola]|uniref:Zinc finger C2H2 LYAR-type domain-containing protein n=1 Tax=Cutaneotrichosporon cavernicola TaxID=279322 RepID=A0AA48LAD7_9TREE|nr:uncharacterized protein CcaverHIS019_0705350 [Cutaneotrichosporon cavernicola]BEI87183.1 hypothetical protein CcaverHIS002_0705290 [Cutaneotrichosporon cavernicola]BEI94954.1 hypothetical protein CcaverHIS019_0705350 [Cutaneotrichosporon cavernicola]BEJ02728.1 hypothetical protein CcaverHIS631_0705230 [Cutaneotrichosporon cavernicola]BEJ10481.1 hypothetical protein CcaverHIS641_0705160 [Cutaneotrichosporon cavernicola]
MVSFQCDGCADTVKKPQLDKHRQRCWASFTCLDCSTTFQNQDYKKHTSCISEAEKYQGKLYRGPKSNATSANPSNQASAAVSATASPAPASEGANIHPSRLRQVEADNSDFDGSPAGYGRGGFGGRGRGRGGFRGRGGGGFAPQPRGFKPTGENLAQPETTMRSWGSTPVPDSTPATPPVQEKRRKGDKGGTGSKANSSTKSNIEEPASKKRKREASEAASATVPETAVPNGPPTDKALKRIRKHMGKLEKKGDMSLAQWIEKVAQGKDKSVDRADVLAGLQVAFVDGKWQLKA